LLSDRAFPPLAAPSGACECCLGSTTRSTSCPFAATKRCERWRRLGRAAGGVRGRQLSLHAITGIVVCPGKKVVSCASLSPAGYLCHISFAHVAVWLLQVSLSLLSRFSAACSSSLMTISS
jgi:hypothetical protein